MSEGGSQPNVFGRRPVGHVHIEVVASAQRRTGSMWWRWWRPMPQRHPALELDRTLIRSPLHRQEPSFGPVPPSGLSQANKGPYSLVGRDRWPPFGFGDLDLSSDGPTPTETCIGRSFQGDLITGSVDKPDWNPSHVLCLPTCRRCVRIERIEGDLPVPLSCDDRLSGSRLSLIVAQRPTSDPCSPRSKQSGDNRDNQCCDGHFRSLSDLPFGSGTLN